MYNVAIEDKLYTSISFLKKHPNMSYEEFYNHWEKIHGPLVQPWMEKYGFRSYTQYHTKPWCNLGAKPLGPETLGCNVLQEYDGAAVIEVDSFEVLEKAFADQYYQTIIAEDEERFLDKSAGVLRTRAEAKKIIKML